MSFSSAVDPHPDEVMADNESWTSTEDISQSPALNAANHSINRVAGGSVTSAYHNVQLAEESKEPVEAADDLATSSDDVDTNTAPDINEGEPLSPVAVPSLLMTKFTLYESRKKLYIVGSNARESRFRMLEIDLTAPKDQLVISDGKQRFTRAEIMNTLQELEDANPGGGFTKRLTAWSLLGFIRFTEGYFMVFITKRSVVALIGGHYVYHIDGTEIIPVAHSRDYKKPDRRSEETRLLSIFQSLDLSKTFYFSYTYDITHTLQHNIIREKERAMGLLERADEVVGEYHEMFVWNHFLLRPVLDNPCYSEKSANSAFDWFRPIIHGFVDQAKISDFGRSVLITIIARRSHYFAGARFLKRGVNDQGNVANEVETEQIVTDHLTTSFHDNRDGIFNSPRYTSYVQHRGSIPLYWSQDSSNMTPKPPIGLNAVDPFYCAAGLHFDDMFSRYGGPILILNLIKSKERTPREMILGWEFANCLNYLNQFLPERSKLQYTAWDMSRAAKGRDQEVIDFLEKYAEETLNKTGIFHNKKNLAGMKIQDGICRSNCIDCLDRTNAAQFVIAKRALAHQLHALGLIGADMNIEYDSDAVNLLTEMFHDHGDTIALQYGGSHLVNTMETYRKINQWTSHSRDMIESIRRFYSNSFVDSQRQEATNLFLGNYIWEKGRPSLWDLPSDHFLHNSLVGSYKYSRSYQKWWIPYNLKTLHERLKEVEELDEFEDEPLLPYRGFYDNYWNECYRPRQLTSFHLIFAYNMNSTLRYLPMTMKLEEIGTSGPFTPRKRPDSHHIAVSGRPHRYRKGSAGVPSVIERRRARMDREHISSSSSNGSHEDSIRKVALKRASMLYQNSAGIPRLLSDRVFSGGKTSYSRLSDLAILEEEEEKPLGREDLAEIESLANSLTEAMTFEKRITSLIEPDVDESTSHLYREYVGGSSDRTVDETEEKTYQDFFARPSRIVDSENISDASYDFYKMYLEKAAPQERFVSGEDDLFDQDAKALAGQYGNWLNTGVI